LPSMPPAIVNSSGIASADHSRKSSVTISATGPSGYIPNGGPASRGAPNLQFGAMGGSPAPSHATPNPRVASPAHSPSPIPQFSGGKPNNLGGRPDISFGAGESTEHNVSCTLMFYIIKSPLLAHTHCRHAPTSLPQQILCLKLSTFAASPLNPLTVTWATPLSTRTVVSSQAAAAAVPTSQQATLLNRRARSPSALGATGICHSHSSRRCSRTHPALCSVARLSRLRHHISTQRTYPPTARACRTNINTLSKFVYPLFHFATLPSRTIQSIQGIWRSRSSLFSGLIRKAHPRRHFLCPLMSKTPF
jgi:hypothetical protein